MDKMSKDAIREILINELSMILGVAVESIAADAPLHTHGLDSLGFVELLVSVEKKFDLALMETGLKKDDFASVDVLSERIYEMLG